MKTEIYELIQKVSALTARVNVLEERCDKLQQENAALREYGKTLAEAVNRIDPRYLRRT